MPICPVPDDHIAPSRFPLFFARDVLHTLIMTLDNGRLREVTAALRQKYRTVRENIPFVGDATALYRQGDNIVRIEAPHLSFSMEVLYLTNRLHEAFNKGSTAE